MIKSFRSITPRIHPTAYIAETAEIIGDVEIGERAGIWPGTIVRADYARITIGRFTQIEDNCTVHGDVPITIGEKVLIGHNVVVHCAKIGDNVLIGNHATLLDYSEIGEGSVVGANAMVNMGMKVPSHSSAYGVPVKITGKVPPERDEIIRLALLKTIVLADEFKKEGI
jgi:carbonic anhydrase/acetyltransferase-like protein (isoleucine patch superfamily)